MDKICTDAFILLEAKFKRESKKIYTVKLIT